jgi:hypothetical protein
MTTERAWTISELNDSLNIYEQELRDKGLRRSSINTYVQHPERFIRWLADDYSPQGPQTGQREAGVRSRSKYDPLYHHLVNSPETVVSLSFAEIERILGFALPASARRHQAWWANEREGTHSHARSWLEASYGTQGVDLNAQTVRFIGQ